MSTTLDEVIALAETYSGVKDLHAGSAVDQDMRITGDDVQEFAVELADRYGQQVRNWPWQRFAELSEPHLFTGFVFLWRLLTWPIRGRGFDPSLFERVELGHIARAIEAGHWIEP